MTNTSVARIKHGTGADAATSSGIRDGSLPGFHFISSGLLVLTARWIRGSPGPRPPRRLATGRGPSPARRQAGRGFWRMVQLQEKCRSDERGISAWPEATQSAGTRSVIRHTKNRLRHVPCGRLRFASGGPRPAAGSICHRANLPYGLTIPVSVLIQADKVIR